MVWGLGVHVLGGLGGLGLRAMKSNLSKVYRM